MDELNSLELKLESMLTNESARHNHQEIPEVPVPLMLVEEEVEEDFDLRSRSRVNTFGRFFDFEVNTGDEYGEFYRFNVRKSSEVVMSEYEDVENIEEDDELNDENTQQKEQSAESEVEEDISSNILSYLK
jgi:hypothetical protein